MAVRAVPLQRLLSHFRQWRQVAIANKLAQQPIGVEQDFGMSPLARARPPTELQEPRQARWPRSFVPDSVKPTTERVRGFLACDALEIASDQAPKRLPWLGPERGTCGAGYLIVQPKQVTRERGVSGGSCVPLCPVAPPVMGC